MSPLVGIGLKLISSILFAIMLAMIKYASQTVPTGEVIFARCLFALIPVVIMAIMQGGWRDCIHVKRLPLHILRAFLGAIAMFMWFGCLRYLPLPEATAISFASPLIVVTLASIILKEDVKLYRWTAVAAGLIGVMIILSPRLLHSEGEVGLLGALLAAGSTVFMASATITIRTMTKTENNASIIFFFFTVMSLLSPFTIFWGWVLPEWQVIIYLILAGIVGGVAQIVVTQAVRMTEASLLAPFDYSSMIWALIIGIVIFGEYPSLPVIIGGAIVVSAGLFVVYRERQLGVARHGETRVRDM